MGLIDIFFKTQKANGQFVSEKTRNSNRIKLAKITPDVLEKMRIIDVTEDKELKLEYVFYTNTSEKASQLALEIKKLGYTADHGPDPDMKMLFMVRGSTITMKTSDSIILNWTEEMSELGYKFDCEFDGWMADTDQQ